MKKKIIISISLFVIIGITSFEIQNLLSKTDNLPLNADLNDVTSEKIQEQKDNTNAKDIEEERRISIGENAFFANEPTLEYLKESSDIIAIASIEDSEAFMEDKVVYSNLNLKIHKMIKSDTHSNTKNLKVRKLGGKISIGEMKKNLSAEEYSKYGFEENESERTILYFDISNGWLDMRSTKEYLVFLEYRDNGELVLNSLNYGIREIQDNKVFDYDTNSYIETDLLS